tara:strand:+ start:109 stop:345 length:237 start_codon:yes stop_codon:yes gene_type:complete
MQAYLSGGLGRFLSKINLRVLGTVIALLLRLRRPRHQSFLNVLLGKTEGYSAWIYFLYDLPGFVPIFEIKVAGSNINF